MFLPPTEQNAELTALAGALVRKALENPLVGEILLLIVPSAPKGTPLPLEEAVFALTARTPCDCDHPKECRVAWMRSNADLIHDIADAEEKGVSAITVAPTHLS